MANLDGSCLCGQVTYGCAADALATAVCHCTECQKQTGTAFSVIVAVPRDAFHVEGESLASFTTVGTDTGKEVARQFCRECGSPIVSFSDGLPELALIKAGTLEDTSWLEPTMDVWCDSAQPWVPLESHAETRLPRGLGA
jgi:hypothetical protein